MIKVVNRDLWRDGVKIGHVVDGHVLDHTGDKVGYFSGQNIFDMHGHKRAVIEGDYIDFLDSGHRVRLEDNEREVAGGDLSNIERAAVRVLLGE